MSKTRRDGIKLIFSGVRLQLHSLLTQKGVAGKLAGVSILPDIDSALREASSYLDGVLK